MTAQGSQKTNTKPIPNPGDVKTLQRQEKKLMKQGLNEQRIKSTKQRLGTSKNTDKSLANVTKKKCEDEIRIKGCYSTNSDEIQNIIRE